MTDTSAPTSHHFIVVGRAGMDLYPEPAGTKIADASQFSAQLGGSAANIAVGLSRMGASVALLTALSDDAVGRFCRNRLAQNGVDCGLIHPSAKETRSSLALSETRVMDHETLIYRNGAADFDLDLACIASLDLTNITAIVITGTALARAPSRDAVFALIDKARHAETDVVLDLDYRPYSWTSPQDASAVYLRAARQSTIVIGNDEEFAVLWGESNPTLAHARRLASEGVALCIYKMGSAGSVSFADGQEVRTGVFPVRALKPVGAGDGFLASFLAAHHGGESLQDSVTRGSAAAALVVTRKGCSDAMPTLAELHAFMDAHAMAPVEARKEVN